MPDSETYRVLAELFRTGPTKEQYSGLSRSSEVLENLPDCDVSRHEDEIAAEHHSMFGFNVFPHASVFLEDDGFLGKDISESVRAFYEESGLFSGDSREAADHITTELLFISKICGNTHVMANFCDNHLFAWLPPFVFAVERQENEFYGQLARFTLNRVITDRKTLPKTDAVENTDGLPMMAPSSVEENRVGDPTDEETIIDRLAVAGKCGLFLSRGDITYLARSLSLPTGFGGRIQMLRTMFDSSESYEKGEDVVSVLASLCEKEISKWNENSGDEIPGDEIPAALLFWSRHWIKKLRASQDLLESESISRP